MNVLGADKFSIIVIIILLNFLSTAIYIYISTVAVIEPQEGIILYECNYFFIIIVYEETLSLIITE